MSRQLLASRTGITSATASFSIGVASIALFVIVVSIGLSSQSLALIVSGTCLGLFGLVLWLSKPSRQVVEPTSALGETEKMVSMVALFSELPFIDEAVLSTHVRSAWGLELQSNQDDESFVAGSAPLFVIKTPHQVYAVNYLDRNYFDNPEEVLEEVTELRLIKAIQSHRAWISVDLISDSEGLDPTSHFAMIGRLLHQMTNENCVALLLPDRMKLLPWDESIEAALISDNPTENLCSSQPPVIPINDDHPKLVAAVAVARDRFSQFVAAFENHQRDENRDERQQFAVKAPISSGGHTEFMWVNTTAIENGILYGTLDNRPVYLPRLSRGDRVRVAVPKLNDWLYTNGDRTFGGFTINVIADWARNQ